MRTTLTLDDDVVALVEGERRRTGESMRQVVNGSSGKPLVVSVMSAMRSSCPRSRGKPRVDQSDTSALISELDDADAVEAHLK